MNDQAQTGRAGPPIHQLVYAQLRDRVLFGDLAPGQAVTIKGLVDDLGAGMTPVREALRRLTTEGALEFQGNRRISVPVLTASEVGELLFARRALEPELTRRATPHVTPDLIQTLSDRDAQLDLAIRHGDMQGYLRHNYLFHKLLYATADAPVLAGIVDGLWLRFGPAMRGVLNSVAMPGTPDMHKALLLALRAHDAEAAARAMEQDIEGGMSRLRAGLTQGPTGGA